MAKFNEVQKKRRALKSEKKRQLHGNPATGKLKNKHQPLSISGKRKRKLFKKWRREQKAALQKGLVTMEDVEMAVTAEAEGGSRSQDSSKPSRKIHLKKGLKLKQVKNKGKNKRKSAAPAAEVSADAMVE